jgi:hypothetical protein
VPDTDVDVVLLLVSVVLVVWLTKLQLYDEGEIPLPALQENDQLVKLVIVKTRLVTALGIPTALDTYCALFVPVVVFDVIAVR